MDITDIILDQHEEQRRLFGFVQQIDRGDVLSLTAVWNRLRALLDVHAEAEERYFYPRLLKEGLGAGDSTSAADETRDAIKDHNEIRDAGKAADRFDPGSDAWFDAVAKADLANSKHMAEEERQGLADFRRHASLAERHELGVRFLAYVCEHVSGVKPVDKNPQRYVSEYQRQPASAEV